VSAAVCRRAHASRALRGALARFGTLLGESRLARRCAFASDEKHKRYTRKAEVAQRLPGTRRPAGAARALISCGSFSCLSRVATRVTPATSLCGRTGCAECHRRTLSRF